MNKQEERTTTSKKRARGSSDVDVGRHPTSLTLTIMLEGIMLKGGHRRSSFTSHSKTSTFPSSGGGCFINVARGERCLHAWTNGDAFSHVLRKVVAAGGVAEEMAKDQRRTTVLRSMVVGMHEDLLRQLDGRRVVVRLTLSADHFVEDGGGGGGLDKFVLRGSGGSGRGGGGERNTRLSITGSSSRNASAIIPETPISGMSSNVIPETPYGGEESFVVPETPDAAGGGEGAGGGGGE